MELNLGIKNAKKTQPKYECTICDFYTSNKFDFEKHKQTKKHIGKKTQQENSEYQCDNCERSYKVQSGLWKHKQKCLQTCIPCEIPDNNNTEPMPFTHEQLEDAVRKMVSASLAECNINSTNTNTNNTSMITNESAITADTIAMIVKQNQEFQKEMFTQIMEFMKNSNNNINNGIINNGHFNLQVYLNETCKNAMTVNQFLDYLQPTLQELEDTAHLGYVESISRIILRGFKNLEEEELPFHCIDLKREYIYVKNPDKEWVKETDDKPILLRFIKEVSKRNFNNIFAWQKQNPTWSSYHSKKNDLYNSIVANAMSGATEKEQNDNYEKIMKNIMKNIVIDKNKIRNKK
jgi:hypothetical protein